MDPPHAAGRIVKWGRTVDNHHQIKHRVPARRGPGGGSHLRAGRAPPLTCLGGLVPKALNLTRRRWGWAWGVSELLRSRPGKRQGIAWRLPSSECASALSSELEGTNAEWLGLRSSLSHSRESGPAAPRNPRLPFYLPTLANSSTHRPLAKS